MFVRCVCDVFAMCVAVFLRFFFVRRCAMCARCLCDVCAVSARCLCGVCAMFMRCLCDVCAAFVWCVCFLAEMHINI